MVFAELFIGVRLTSSSAAPTRTNPAIATRDALMKSAAINPPMRPENGFSENLKRLIVAKGTALFLG